MLAPPEPLSSRRSQLKSTRATSMRTARCTCKLQWFSSGNRPTPRIRTLHALLTLSVNPLDHGQSEMHTACVHPLCASAPLVSGDLGPQGQENHMRCSPAT